MNICSCPPASVHDALQQREDTCMLVQLMVSTLERQAHAYTKEVECVVACTHCSTLCWTGRCAYNGRTHACRSCAAAAVAAAAAACLSMHLPPQRTFVGGLAAVV